MPQLFEDNNMRYKIDWYAWEVKQGISLLKKYMASMENQFFETQENAFKDLIKEQPQLDVTEYDEKSSVFRHTYKWEYPRNLRYSFVILISIFLETKLAAACEEIKTRRNIVEEIKSLHGDKIGRAMKFLKKHAKITWENVDQVAIDSLATVRNCIAHTSGTVSLSKDRAKLKAA